MQKEIWKNIPEFENYQISNLGNLKSVKENKLLKFYTLNGYFVARLFKNGKIFRKRVHRLVGQAFISNPNNYPYINHIDGNKKNNCVDNLEWCTPRQNTLHAYKLGLMKTTPVNQYDMQHTFLKTWGSIIDASKSLGINRKIIQSCCKNRKKSAGGYIWKYANK